MHEQHIWRFTDNLSSLQINFLVAFTAVVVVNFRKFKHFVETLLETCFVFYLNREIVENLIVKRCIPTVFTSLLIYHSTLKNILE